ncbi:hypothetical protein NIES4071_02490 [Calothrix sp. NIES-4071]|nr:hypothetical protein NIES4071_02490 [Calothrix sp. NIES-4071]BAZ54595.1 hypothetical protein NIES4105_02480 [Calothrix sp. NIES-4105]
MVRELIEYDAADLDMYPSSDGEPMSDNTIQFRWIVLIKENLEILFAKVLDVFVAGDLAWYPVEKKGNIKCAPDAMVVFGRPKGDRSAYIQYLENNVAPQVVFEILSPGNTDEEMVKKLDFYQTHGVEEYYLYDPSTNNLQGWLRANNLLKRIKKVNNWISPRLKIKFVLTPVTLEIYYPDGRKFLTPVELDQQRQLEQQQRLEAERRAQLEQQQRTLAEQRAERLAAKLRELGEDPDLI